MLMTKAGEMTLTQAAIAVDGELAGADVTFSTVGTDTRKLTSGSLFIALKGERFDAHDYVEQARAAGASALMVERRLPCELPQIIVADTRLALGRLAHAWRKTMTATVLAVTGSNGKTSVKEMMCAILSRVGPTLATEGNLNNDIGMPLMLLRIRPEHHYAVIEMGTNAPGEIGYLTSIAMPDVALITNAGTAHLEGLGSIEGVAREKGAIYGGLGMQGTAIINYDDAYAGYWQGLNHERKVMSFGLNPAADVWADWLATAGGSQVILHAAQGEAEFQLRLLGRHNVANAMAAAAACLAAGATLEQVAAGLAAARPVAGRLQARKGLQGAQIIHDAYNANPGSVAAALAVLAASDGRRILVLGDMGELGADAEAFHRGVGQQAHESGIDAVFATGDLTTLTIEAFGAQGRHFASKEALIAALCSELSSNDVVLVKGSRSMRMEQVVDALTEQEAN